MTDQRLSKFITSAGHAALVVPYGTDDDEAIEHFVWLLDVPEEDLCRVQDEAIHLSFRLYDPEPVPFMIGVADPEKSKVIRTEAGTTLSTSAGAKGVQLSESLGKPNSTEAQAGHAHLHISIGWATSQMTVGAPPLLRNKGLSSNTGIGVQPNAH